MNRARKRARREANRWPKVTPTTFFGQPATRSENRDGSGYVLMADGGVWQMPPRPVIDAERLKRLMDPAASALAAMRLRGTPRWRVQPWTEPKS